VGKVNVRGVHAMYPGQCSENRYKGPIGLNKGSS